MTATYSVSRDEMDIALRVQGDVFFAALGEQHAHLFAGVRLAISAAQMTQMEEVIAAAEAVLSSPPDKGELEGVSVLTVSVKPETPPNLPLSGEDPYPDFTSQQCVTHFDDRGGGLGVFYGYDFHLNADGAHLIEINTNAGGGFLNALLHEQRAVEDTFLAMFRNEWRLARGDAPLSTVAIVDEQPATQYLYPEFILAKQMFERAGIAAHIVDPAALEARADGLYVNEAKVDLLYNRLTDFALQRFSPLLFAYQNQQVVLTPNPAHYQRHADKRHLVHLSEPVWMRRAGVPEASIDALLRGVPETKMVRAEDAEQWWAERKQWFFKPVHGYGSKGAYRGDKLTRRVFEDIVQGEYIAQKLAVPGEVEVLRGEEKITLKYDVRCYVYDGKIQLVAARLYQGQTTNFRTAGGGFAAVQVLG